MKKVWPQVRIQESKEVRLLILGDATSNMGIGHNYADFLRKKLELTYPQRHFLLFNEAQGGAHSRLFVERLPALLKKYDPHLVLVMTGIDDAGPYQPAQNEGGPFASCEYWNCYQKKLLSLQKNPLERGRLHYQFKNFPAASADFYEAANLGWNLFSAEDFQQFYLASLHLNKKIEASEVLRQFLKKYPECASLERILGEVYRLNRVSDPELLLGLLKESTRLTPTAQSDALFQQILFEIYSTHPDYWNLQKSTLAFEKLKKMGRLNAFVQETYLQNLLRFGRFSEASKLALQWQPEWKNKKETWPWKYVFFALAHEGRKQELKELELWLKQNFPQITFWQRQFLASDYSRQALLTPRASASWDPYTGGSTRENYQLIRRLVEKNDAILVALAYPRRPSTSLAQLFSRHPKVRVIENNKVFQDKESDTLFLDFFAGDTGHLTALGGELMAENILPHLRDLFQ